MMKILTFKPYNGARLYQSYDLCRDIIDVMDRLRQSVAGLVKGRTSLVVVHADGPNTGQVAYAGFPLGDDRYMVRSAVSASCWSIPVPAGEQPSAIRHVCRYCGEAKVAGEPCPGCDQCIYGPGGGRAQPCQGWGRYCCRCGADFARGQM